MNNATPITSRPEALLLPIDLLERVIQTAGTPTVTITSEMVPSHGNYAVLKLGSVPALYGKSSDGWAILQPDGTYAYRNPLSDQSGPFVVIDLDPSAAEHNQARHHDDGAVSRSIARIVQANPVLMQALTRLYNSQPS